MKRSILVGALGAVLAVAAYLAGHGSAQQTYNQQRQAALQSRIAIINLGQVIRSYKKFQNFEQELRAQSQSIQKVYEEKKAQATNEQKEAERADTAPERRDQLGKDIKRIERELQDTVEEAKQRLSKAEFTQLQQTYREVYDAVEAYARAYAIEMVFQYSDAVGNDRFTNPGSLQRKLTNNACIPMYFDGRLDITDSVVQMLNQRYAQVTGQPGTSTNR